MYSTDQQISPRITNHITDISVQAYLMCFMVEFALKGKTSPAFATWLKSAKITPIDGSMPLKHTGLASTSKTVSKLFKSDLFIWYWNFHFTSLRSVCVQAKTRLIFGELWDGFISWDGKSDHSVISFHHTYRVYQNRICFTFGAAHIHLLTSTLSDTLIYIIYSSLSEGGELLSSTSACMYKSLCSKENCMCALQIDKWSCKFPYGQNIITRL